MNKLSNLPRGRWVVPTVVGITAFSGGGVAGYFATKRRYEPYVEACDRLGQLVDELTEVVERHAKELNDVAAKGEAFDRLLTSVDDVVQELGETPKRFIGENVVQLPERKSVFDGRDNLPEWDEEAELTTRSSARPYIIHKDEYIEDQMGFKQYTLTYYKGDDILVDELEVPIYHRAQFGELKFGHGSGDPNVVYIRNEKEQKEWEIVLHEGRYGTEVLGQDVEAEYESQDLKHSSSPRRFLRE